MKLNNYFTQLTTRSAGMVSGQWFGSLYLQLIDDLLEDILCNNITKELLLQKELEKRKDDKTDLAL